MLFSFLREHKGDGEVPCVFLLLLVSDPIVNQIFCIPDSPNSRKCVMAGEHAKFGLIKLIDLRLHALGTVVDWNIVMVHKSLDVFLSLLFLDILLPDAKHIDPTALIIRACEGMLVVPISLAVIKTHQATFLENVVGPNDLDQLGVRWHSLEVGFCFQLLKLLLIFVLEVFLCLHWIQLTTCLLL